jgi:hypothetical protein
MHEECGLTTGNVSTAAPPHQRGGTSAASRKKGGSLRTVMYWGGVSV